MKGIRSHWLAPGWNLLPAVTAIAGASAVHLLGGSGRLMGLIAFAAFAFLMGLADVARERIGAGSRHSREEDRAGLASWLGFMALTAVGSLYVLGTIIAAARGLPPRITDTVAFASVAAVGLAIGSRRRILWTALGIGAVLGIALFPALPRNPDLAGVEPPLEGAGVQVTWFIDGAHVWIDNPMDPQVEHNNDRTLVWTVERKWRALNEARIGAVGSARAEGLSCLDLERRMGSDGLVETLSWMDGVSAEALGEVFECPAARLDEIERSLSARLGARGEEAAAREALETGSRDKAISRAKLAIQICGRAGYARAVAGGGLLRRGIARLRRGDREGAIGDLEEAIGLIPEDGDRARALVALGRALDSRGNRSAAKRAYERAIVIAPGTAAAREAERATRRRADRNPAGRIR